MNKARIPEMKDYLIKNKDNYVFSSITASIDAGHRGVNFSAESKSGTRSKIGVLTVPMNAKFLINDGQHRKKAIEEAIKHNPELGSEMISVVFYLDLGLKRSQQMFSDLNKHAVKTTKSLNILYDHRDDFSLYVKKMLDKVPIFKLTDLEKTSIPKKSNKVFTLNMIHCATQSLLGKPKNNAKVNNAEKRFAISFWNEIYSNMKPWQDIVQGKITPSEAREKYVNVHGVLLHAIGIMGNSLKQKNHKNWKPKLKKLNNIDWRKANNSWEGRALVAGKLTKVSANLTLTSNLLKSKLNLNLSESERKIENGFAKR